ncbi:hypothetical protein Tco_0337064 [Tanacetum coccineum]
MIQPELGGSTQGYPLDSVEVLRIHNDGGEDIVMSDIEDSTVTYIEAPPSPNYVPGPEKLEQAPPSPEFIPGLVYSKIMPSEDEVFPAEEQPLPGAVSPTTDLPRYIADSDPEEDREDPEEDPKEDPIDYSADRGDDDDDDDESSDDDEDDDDVEEDEDEEEEHPALADSIPPPVHRVTDRISVRAQTPISLPSDTKVARLLAIPTPPLSPLSSLSSPLPQILSPLPQILLPPLPLPSLPLPVSPTYPLGYRAAMIRLRAETPSTSHPLPSNYRAGVSQVTLPPQKRLCIALGLRYEERPRERCWLWDYKHLDEMLVGMPGAPATNDMELGQRMTNFVTTVRQDTNEIYGRLDEAHDRAVLSSRLKLLQRDRRSHAYISLPMEREGRLSCEAWGRSMAASDTARSEVMELRTTMLAQQTEIAALRAADRAR